jgi:hypothetical protein
MKKIYTLAAISIFSVFGLGASCGATKVACQIIKTANDACTMIETVGADGKPVQTPVTNEELQGFAKMAAARRDAEKAAGVPMGAALPDAGAK